MEKLILCIWWWSGDIFKRIAISIIQLDALGYNKPIFIVPLRQCNILYV
jgi:hypothetical protein